MKNKIEMLLEFGVTKKKIADILGIAPTNITRCVNYNMPLSPRHERVLDDYIIEFHNKLFMALKGDI